MLDEYGITRDDFVVVMSGIVEQQKGEWSSLSKEKSALTRMYNKTVHRSANQYADDDSLFHRVVKGKRGKGSQSQSQSRSQSQSSSRSQSQSLSRSQSQSLSRSQSQSLSLSQSQLFTQSDLNAVDDFSDEEDFELPFSPVCSPHVSNKHSKLTHPYRNHSQSSLHPRSTIAAPHSSTAVPGTAIYTHTECESSTHARPTCNIRTTLPGTATRTSRKCSPRTDRSTAAIARSAASTFHAPPDNRAPFLPHADRRHAIVPASAGASAPSAAPSRVQTLYPSPCASIADNTLDL